MAPEKTGRIAAIDLGRSVALLGMAAFHFCYDLEAFGHLPPGTMETGVPYYFARSVAGSFLFLAGLSLHLAHGRQLRLPAFLKRLGIIIAAALLITIGTRYVLGPYFVFFGILHSIAVSSIIGLVFLRAPVPMILIMAIAAALAPYHLASTYFDTPWLWWTGLSSQQMVAVDFVPTLPWLAPFLCGMAAGRLGSSIGLWTKLLPFGQGKAAQMLSWPGRHSLIIYLIHQPLMIGALRALTYLRII